MKYSKIIVLLCIVLAVAFTVAVLALMASGMAEPVVLIPSFFAFITGELWALSSIKKQDAQESSCDAREEEEDLS